MDGGTKRHFMGGFETEAEAETYAENSDWRFVDENRFEWRLEVEEDTFSERDMERNRRTEEVEAESISYAVCQYYGIQTGENSFGYIASWSQGKELKELRASLETINKTSSELIGDIDRHFAAICKERGIDPKIAAQQAETKVEHTLQRIRFSTQRSRNTKRKSVQLSHRSSFTKLWNLRIVRTSMTTILCTAPFIWLLRAA